MKDYITTTMKCQHDMQSGSTLIVLPKRYGVLPKIYDCYCSICHKAFSQIGYDSNNYAIIEGSIFSHIDEEGRIKL